MAIRVRADRRRSGVKNALSSFSRQKPTSERPILLVSTGPLGLEPKVLDQGYEPLNHQDLIILKQCLKRHDAPFASDRGQFYTTRWRATVLSTNTSTTGPLRPLFIVKLNETEPFGTNEVR
jgi:hypothetical protein